MRLVLMYHDIVTQDDKSSGFQDNAALQYKVDINRFEEHVKTLPPDKVLFSFDDGGYSFLLYAAPILEKYGHTGLFFIATDYIGTPGFLDAQQIKDLYKRGHIIGSHSCSHPRNMTTLSENEILHEWKHSIQILENIVGHKVEYASIPNGFASQVVIEQAKLAGIHYLYTSKPTSRIARNEDMQIIGRYVVHNTTSTQYISRLAYSRVARIKRYIKWSILEVIKTLLGNHYDNVKSLFVK